MAVLYKNLYKNIDLRVYGIEKQIEYDWIVKPGGNPGDIRFKYKNVKGTRIDKDGNLLIETEFGELMHKCPVSYQEIDKKKIVVKTEFKKISKNIYGFEVNEYVKNYELIIDPVVLAYSTYLGGNDDDGGRGIAADSSGNAYVTGYTWSTNFPTKNQYQSDETDGYAFVTKLEFEEPSITVTSPNGGEAWEVESIHDITWTSTGSVGNVKLEVTTDNGSNWTVFDASALNDGVRPWVVPNTPSSNCKIRISETDGSP